QRHRRQRALLIPPRMQPIGEGDLTRLDVAGTHLQAQGHALQLPVVELVARPVDKRSEEHTSELQSPYDLVCRLLLEKKNRSRSTRSMCWLVWGRRSRRPRSVTYCAGFPMLRSSVLVRSPASPRPRHLLTCTRLTIRD